MKHKKKEKEEKGLTDEQLVEKYEKGAINLEYSLKSLLKVTNKLEIKPSKKHPKNRKRTVQK